MAAFGARALKPVGSATWISSEKENITNLVDQEMEEVEFPVRNEMEWLNEHMAEIFSKDQLNLTEAFKTPGKLRGKTPRTARKRNVEETRMPLSEIFSSHNQMETKSNASPTDYRTVAAKASPQTTTNVAREDVSQPHYPDLSKNLNSFSQYNSDSGYHGMPDDATEVALSQTQPDSQTSDQPLQKAPEASAPVATHENRTSTDHRMTQGSFHSTQENVRLHGQTAEPMDVDPRQEQIEEAQQPKSHLKEPELERALSEPEHETQRTEPETQMTEPQLPEPEKMEFEPARHESAPRSPLEHKKTEYKPAGNEPEAYKPAVSESVEHEPLPIVSTHEPTDKPTESEPKSPISEIAPTKSQHGPTEPEPKPVSEPEQKQIPESESKLQPAPDAKSPRTKVPAAKEEEESHDETADPGKEDMDLDNLDDIGSPSDGSTPEPVPIRKSSLTFASLPARDPLLTKKSIGGSRISRTSHVDPLHAGRSSYLGRQTGGHRVTQSATEQNAPQTEKMDVDNEMDVSRKDTDEGSRASQLHSKSSTQRLHEKISMLGKLQPSRPTKSIPSVAGLPSAQVTYPELPHTKTESKTEVSGQKNHDVPAADTVGTEDNESSHTPRRLNSRDQNSDVGEKDILRTVETEDPAAARPQSSNGGQRPRSNTTKSTREKSATPAHSIGQERGRQESPSMPNLASGPEPSTTPGGSPRRFEGPLSSSKFKLQSIMKSAKGLFSNSAGASVAARTGTLSPTPSREGPHDLVKTHAADRNEETRQLQHSSPPRQEGRRTRSSTEKEEKRRQEEQRQQEELEIRRQEEERVGKLREQDMEKQKTAQAKAAQEKSSAGQEGRAVPTHAYATLPSPKKVPQHQRQVSKEPEIHHDAGLKHAVAPVAHQQLRKPTDRRPIRPTREPTQKTQPQPVSIRVGSALSRQMPLASTGFSSSVQDPNPAPTSAPAPAPTAPHITSAAKPPTIKKKASNTSLQTASSAGSLKGTISSQSQRKAQLASERKKEQEEREAKRKEEQKRELARKRAAQQQQQEETRRRERERHVEDPKRAAQMQEIEKRRLMNARRLDRQGSQQPPNELHERTTPGPSQRGDLGNSRPASRLGSIQSFSRPINPPAPNPAKPPKRHLDEEAETRPAAPKSSAVQPSGESKRRKTEEEHHNPPPIRPAMAPPIRQSNIRKEPSKPSIFGHGQHSVSHQAGSSIFKTAPHTGPAQSQRPAHPMDMAKYTSGKIPFAEPSNPPAQQQYKAPAAPSTQKAAGKPSPKYPNGENINLPEIPTDSEDEDSESDILPVPKWAQPKELENILRQQDGMETDSIFGPVAPFSLEDTFKSDKKIKKFRDRTSSANWTGTDALTQEEIHTDLAERQRFKHNGGWSMRQ